MAIRSFSTKKVMCAILIVLFLFSSFDYSVSALTPPTWTGEIASSFDGGSGTKADPFLISNGAQLAYLAQSVNDGNNYSEKYFALTNDIYLNDITNWEKWPEVEPKNTWTPIGNQKNCFAGTFDGKNHTIYGVFFNNDTSNYIGLFGVISNARIQNVNLSNSYICAYSAGGIAGLVVVSTISNCSNSGTIKCKTGGGGIAGRCELITTSTTIWSGPRITSVVNCKNTGQITGWDAGGILGEIYMLKSASYYVEHCTNEGNVASETSAAGIVGQVYFYADDTNIYLRNNLNKGIISGGHDLSGIVGYLVISKQTSSASIENCVNTGSIDGSDHLGGMLGHGFGNISISQSYNAGSITGTYNLGGICGHLIGISDYESEGTVLDCYNCGDVTGDTSCGGVIGDCSFDNAKNVTIKVINTYSAGQITAYERVGSIIGCKDNSELENCYYLANTALDSSGTAQNGIGSNAQGHTTQDKAGQVTSLSDSKMKQTSSFVGFDFNEVWCMCQEPDYKYPVLQSLYSPSVHVHNLMAIPLVPASCEADGLEAYWMCSGCGKLFSDAHGQNEINESKTIKATGHKWDSGKVTKEPTEASEGIMTFTCSVCGKTRIESIQKLIPSPTVKNPFKDVKQDAYYYDSVLWAVNHKPQITNGTGPDSFSPDATCTRGQVVTFLWRAAGEPAPKNTRNPFKDVSEDSYYYKAVLWAIEKGITNGTGATTFSPEVGCTRGQVVTFLYRANGEPKVTATNPFTDVSTGQYYFDAVLWAVKNEITNGTSATTFSPNATCTRGQIVTFLYRDMK